MLNLRGVVRHLPGLQKALIGSKSELLCIICDVRSVTLRVFTLSRRLPQMLSDERLANVEGLISKSLNEGASLQKVSSSDLTQDKPISFCTRRELPLSMFVCTL